MNRPLAQQIATQMAIRMANEDGVCVDPITIILITSIVIEIIILIYECQQDDDDGLEILHNPSSAHNKKLNRVLRRKLGYCKYLLFGRRYIKELKQSAKDTNKQILHDLYKENVPYYGSNTK